MIRAFRKNSGFSLIELSLVLAIVGFVGATLLENYRGYLRTKIKNDTNNHAEVINKALTSFVTNYGRLPCPADPTLRPGQMAGLIKAGEENCTGTLGGVIEVPGHRKTSSSPTWTGWETNTASANYGNSLSLLPFDPVRIGSVPYLTLGISVRDTLDGWGNRFTYAVSHYMSDADTFNYDNGVIDVLKLENPNTATEKLEKVINEISVCPLGSDSRPGTSLLGTCNANNPPDQDRVGAILFVVVSHGRDGKGAYTYEGRRDIACNATPGRDVENCDDDRTFVDADAGTSIFTTVHRPALSFPVVTGSDPDVYFDDTRTLYSMSRSNDKWSFNNATQMFNKTQARVGVGVKLPQVGLHVGGNVRVDQDVRADEFCSTAWDDLATGPSPDKPSYCFPVSKFIGLDGSLSGTGVATQAMGCPGALMTGLALGEAICETQADLSVMSAAVPCIAGTYAKGIDGTGSIICAAP